MENIDYENLARIITKAGVILVESGAEIYRVEDTMYRLCQSYGASTIDAYATPTLLIISFTINGQLCHNIKRVRIKGTNLTKIEEVNKLSRLIAKHPVPLEELEAALNKIANQPLYKPSTIILASAVVGFGFGFFHGGGIKEAIFAGLIGSIVATVQNFLNKFESSSFLRSFFLSFVLTFLASLCGKMGLCDRDITIIASIMLLVPGIAITNAVRDSVSGDLVSGLARTVEAIIVAVAIAIGSALALIMTGGI